MSSHPLPNNIKININLNIDSSKSRLTPHQNELCIGRKIENNKVEFIGNNDLTSIKKFPIPVEIAKPHKRIQNKSQETDNIYGIDNGNERQNIREANLMKKEKINQKNQSLFLKKSVNSSLAKPRNKSKKQQLGELLKQLQKLTPEIHDFLQKQENKPNKSKSPNKNSAFSPQAKNKKKKKSVKNPKKNKKDTNKNASPSSNQIKEKENSLKNNNKSSEMGKSFMKEKNDKFFLKRPKEKGNFSKNNDKSTEIAKSFMNEKIEKSFLNQSSEQSSKLTTIIREKSKKMVLEKLVEKQKATEMEQRKMEKMKEIMQRNEEIRKVNKTRFLSIPKRNKSKPNVQKSKHKPKRKPNEGERREELGLSWLNGLDETKYVEILERNRAKSQEKSRETTPIQEKDRRKSQEKRPESQDLKSFILIKKKEYQENVRNMELQKKEEEHRKVLNLKQLNESINKKKQKSTQNNSNSFDKKPLFQTKTPSNHESSVIIKKNLCEEYIDGPHNLLTASFNNQILRIPTENEHLDERIEIEELDKSSSFSEKNYVSSQEAKKPNFQDNDSHNDRSIDEEKLNYAANLIQRIWRGYKTRQLVEEYLRYMLMGREEEQFLEYYPDGSEPQINQSLNSQYIEKEPQVVKKSLNEMNYDDPLSLKQKMASNSLTGEGMIVYKDSSEKDEDFDELLGLDLEHKNIEEVEKVVDFQKEFHKIRESNHQELQAMIAEVRKSLESNTKNVFNNEEFDDTSNKDDPDFEKRQQISRQELLKTEEENNRNLNEQFEHLYSNNNNNQNNDELQRHFMKNHHEVSNDKNGNNVSNILHYKEINENSKSLITVKDFDCDYSDFLIEKEDYKIPNKKHLNLSNDALVSNFSKYSKQQKEKQPNFMEKQPNFMEKQSNFSEKQSNLSEKQSNFSEKQHPNLSEKPSNFSEKKSNTIEKQTDYKEKQLNFIEKQHNFLRKSREKSSTEMLHDQLMENLKSFEILATKPTKNQPFPEDIQEKEADELRRIKNEQFSLWKEMIENLKRLQEGSQMNHEIKSQIQELERFSELNLLSLKGEGERVFLKGKQNQMKARPALQINIEEDNNGLKEGSDNIKNTPSEENPSSSVFGDSMKPNYKGETPPSNEHTRFENNPISIKSSKIDVQSIFCRKSENSSLRNIGKFSKTNEKETINQVSSPEIDFENSKDNLKTLESPNIFIEKRPQINIMESPRMIDEKKTEYKPFSKETPGRKIEKLDPFEEFALRHKSEQKKPQNLIEMREKVLEIRQEAEMKQMQQMLACQKCSPKSFEFKKRELEKWVTSERNEIDKTRNDLRQTWLRTTDTIQKTKRDLAFLKKIAGQNEFPEYNMRFSFSQDDLFAQKSFMFKSCESLKKDHEVIRVFDDRPNEKSHKNPEMFTNESRSKASENTNKPISREDMFEEYRDSEESKRVRSEDGSQLSGRVGNFCFEKKNVENGEKSNFFKEKKEQPTEKNNTLQEESLENKLNFFKGKNEESMENKANFFKKKKSEEQIGDCLAKKENFREKKDFTEESKMKEILVEISKNRRNSKNDDESIVKKTNISEDEHALNSKGNIEKETNGNVFKGDIEKETNNEIEEELHKENIEVDSDFKGHIEDEPNISKGEIEEELSLHVKETIENTIGGTLEVQRDIFKAQTTENKANFFKVEKTENRGSLKDVKTEEEEQHEVIKLDFFMDFQELEDELGKEEDISDNYRNMIQDKSFTNKEAASEKPQENLMFWQKNNAVCDGIFEFLLNDVIEDPLFMKHKEFISNSLGKKPHTPHNSKEFDSHFPKEDFCLIKSQEFLKTENSRMMSSAASVIKDYLRNLKEFLLKNKSKPLGKIILMQINTPLGYKPPEKLRFLHKNLYKFSALLAENVMIPYIDREIPRSPVIPDETFERLNEEICKKMKNNYLLEEVKSDYFRLIFNSFNESLDFFRPYGIKGQPDFLKCLKSKKCEEIDEDKIENIYNKAIAKTLEWADTLCGLLPDKDEKTIESNDADMDYVSQLREEKMGRMLAQEVMESEADWVNYDEEEVEIKLEISQLVWDEFLLQNVNEIYRVLNGRKEVSSV